MKRGLLFAFATALSMGFLAFSCSNSTDSASHNSVSTQAAVDSPAHTVALEAVSAEIQPETIPVDTPAVDSVPNHILLGKIKQHSDPDFVHIDPRYTNKPKIYLRKEAYEAFLDMRAAAESEGIRLEIVSATRNFDYQRGIWERKWTGVTKVGGQNLASTLPDPERRAEKILRYSSMPGTSRHHWGTDIDLNSLNNSYFESGAGKKVYDWLIAHAGDYGYCQTYTEMGEERPHGYQEEKWHWSYTPISSRFLAAYKAQISPELLSGFKGAEAVRGLKVIERYVGGINPDCR